ncbi:glycosyltransferase family 4 protein [Wenxinia marina]|uniref:Glycosyltransferase n=1 Tax=Wenxinia marina DSM 24838 TaxID=1123501 RepID=A0A0D0QIM3_9RHOB|nr:glycosyltransferase family 4 protein [Wenxinia marina]KIQ70918.1 Glycosyltransferase [Wenxinia marina DSM 24838]GGL56288.1 hypothetical protein GCM10011392_08440 [Wenxinia marina]
MANAGERHRLKVAYLCDFSPLDGNLYSGGNARLFRALQDHVGDVTILPNHWGLAEPLRRAILALPEALTIRLRWRAHLVLSPLIARVVNRALRRGDYDVLFCAYSFQSLAAVRPPDDVLTVYTSDATPTIYKNSAIGRSFGSFFGPSRLLDPAIERAEGRIFSRVDLLVWPSNWLRSRVAARYDVDPSRSVKVPWGANIDDPEPASEPPRLSPDAPVRLLMVGRDWRAKGGPTTLATLRELQARGVDATLDIVGCDPDEARGVPGVTIHASLDKSDPDQLARFQDLYRTSHFFVMPSFESFGFAYCEASAFGLPSLCLSVGGIPVLDGRNGHALDIGAEATDFADRIADYLADPAAYDALRVSTRAEYDERLNWDAWGRKVRELIAGAMDTRARTVSAPSPEERHGPSAA